ncbi:MAG TPA: TetR/AcrR family transcriptional regulator [Flavipsychrobacter sp.]|nr:TetR/AcrR family transcriptional regulator [Flavipsychrobacter sp.]
MEALTKILSAGVELFSQYGFKTITMDDIARRAGISKKTLYQHFANKEEVVREAVIWYKNHLDTQCRAMMEDTENAIEAMVRIKTMMDHSYKQTNPMVIMELQRYYPEGYKVFRESLVTQDVEAVKKNLQQGIEEGLYRENLNVDLVARFHIESALLLMQPNLMVNEREDLKAVNHEITELFLYGIMTPKGEKLYHKYKEKYLKHATKS